ncbi:MAG: hypothetical protein PHD76_13780 [Methylacidiphilales bacterium]|nr:hypothetical protein [Candidatus Methylacidiphilales bacterium]
MHRDFEIIDGIYLSQPPCQLDLHNNFDFHDLHYSIENRTLSLHWRRGKGEWVSSDTPASVCVEFREVSEFRFHPRDPKLPFTEDDCVSTFGFWTDEEWADGIILAEPTQIPDPNWLTAINFMSGAVIAVQAASAHARIVN